jgi:two-component system sensor histidine kinase/response regulator
MDLTDACDGWVRGNALIRAKSGHAVKAPIFALTAQPMEDDRQRCLDAGMGNYIAKPLALQAPRCALEQWAPALK